MVILSLAKPLEVYCQAEKKYTHLKSILTCVLAFFDLIHEYSSKSKLKMNGSQQSIKTRFV